MEPGFSVTGGRGFHITFPNGVTVSVQFGVGNYCQHHMDDFEEIGHEREKQRWQSTDAEIAIFVDDGTWLTKQYKPAENTDVLGWQTPSQVLEALTWAANYKVEAQP